MIKSKTLFYILIILMAGIIALSNYLIQFQINDWLTWATFTFPLCFLINDVGNRFLGAKSASIIIFFGFILGVIFSFITSDIRIALASGSAFLLSQFLDLSIFNKLRANMWFIAPLTSSIIASVVDNYSFYFLAFYGTDVPWVTLSSGDLLFKFLVAIVALIPYRILILQLRVKDAVVF